MERGPFDSGEVSEANELPSSGALTKNRSVNAAHWIIAIGLTLAAVTDAFNGAIFTIARPHLMGDFRVTPDEVTWVNLAYLVSKTVCLPVAAWFVDRFGETRSLFWSIFIVTVTSVACLLAVHLLPFVAARIFQGGAGAVLLVAAQTILFRLFPINKQGLVQAVYAFGVVVAPTALAPAVMGWLTDEFSWVWGFGVNLVLVLLAISCLGPYRRHLPNSLRVRRPFDWIGFHFFLLSMTALIYVLLEGSRWNWFDDDHITFWSLVSVGALIAFIVWRFFNPTRSELYDRAVFANTQFAFGFLVSFVAGFVLFGSAFLIPVFALNVLQLPSKEAGMLMLPSCMTIGAALLFAGALMSRKNISPLTFVPFGVSLVMMAMWMLSWSSSASGANDLWPSLLLRGLGLGFLFISITIVALNGLIPEQVASGVGLFNFGRQMGGILGVSFLTTYLNHQTALNRLVLIENINSASLSFQQYQELLATALTSRGLDPEAGSTAGSLLMQNSIITQVATLSFNEAFFSLVLLFLVAVPLVLAFKLTQKLVGNRR
ncbi:DHA2 family efflux MFS transporter permease subunit [Candidatus Nitrotoga sp. M5]|uniref:DHA2 family efflux MFS transporter permease subunit n=1 Tax=Candidatus Nitrotoga sp. M5 TaxID=2890409 RepID=UPI001EF466C1|nr:DHA2 family efflux MFS transporter permease subunit [Candidatus Nitrotoga sp. M5]